MKQHSLIALLALAFVTSCLTLSCEEESDSNQTNDPKLSPVLEIIDYEPKQVVEGDTVRIFLKVENIDLIKINQLFLNGTEIETCEEGTDYIDFRLPFQSARQHSHEVKIVSSGFSERIIEMDLEFKRHEIEPLEKKYGLTDSMVIEGSGFSHYSKNYTFRFYSGDESEILSPRYERRHGNFTFDINYKLPFQKEVYFDIMYDDSLVYQSDIPFTIVGKYEVNGAYLLQENNEFSPFSEIAIHAHKNYWLDEVMIEINGQKIAPNATTRHDIGRRYIFNQLPFLPLGKTEIKFFVEGNEWIPFDEDEGYLEIVNATYNISNATISQGENLEFKVLHITNRNYLYFYLYNKDGSLVSSGYGSDETNFDRIFRTYSRQMNEIPSEYSLRLFYQENALSEDRYELVPVSGSTITIVE